MSDIWPTFREERVKKLFGIALIRALNYTNVFMF